VKMLYGKPHLNITYWGYAVKDFIMHSNFNGSIHNTGISPFELWYGEKPDLNKYPMLPFGSIVMAHIPVSQQTAGSQRSQVTYCVGTSLAHKKGLILYNPQTKREIIRGTFKTLGPIRPTIDRMSYEVTSDDDIVELPMMTDIETHDVNDYKFLINTEHLDYDMEDINLILYRTVDVVVESSDAHATPIIVAYRRRVQSNGKLFPMTDDDDWPYIVDDILQMTLQHSQSKLDNPPKSLSKSLLNTYIKKHTDILNNPISTSFYKTLVPKQAYIAKTATKPTYVFPANRLPRNRHDINRMALDNPDRQGFIDAEKTEIQSILNMGTYNPNETLPNPIDKTLLGNSKFVYTKKFHPDGKFDKYKARLVFRGDKWYDVYNNKTYAGTVMTESVRLLLAIAAAEDLELESADVNSAFLYGEIPSTQSIYMKRPSGLTDVDMPPVVRLLKSIYGLPMASAKFRVHSDQTLKRMGFNPTISDPRIYVKFYSDGNKAYISVHVDDLGIAASNQTIMNDIKSDLLKVYKLNFNTEFNYYLGMLIERDRKNNTIKVSKLG